ncbi:MAG: hypothetical protein WA970_00850, partial [Gammaproteobacteria bacterium]
KLIEGRRPVFTTVIRMPQHNPTHVFTGSLTLLVKLALAYFGNLTGWFGSEVRVQVSGPPTTESNDMVRPTPVISLIAVDDRNAI